MSCILNFWLRLWIEHIASLVAKRRSHCPPIKKIDSANSLKTWVSAMRQLMLQWIIYERDTETDPTVRVKIEHNQKHLLDRQPQR